MSRRTARRMAKAFTAGTPHNAHIRVISFGKMLRGVEVRNPVFFDQLTSGSSSLAAKKWQAKAREKHVARKVWVNPAT
ncbi:MAG: hypothetical protein EON59_02840 [Alphaproteobacteria bacterium]|nr:MAG: hypothetical protein EON59_02840 [Alphaproteobacteria bacterium]